MKYFTTKLVGEFPSPDDDGFVEAHEEWEQAIKRYDRRMAKIKKLLPKGARQFEDNRVCLHDADVLRIAQQGDSFVMVLQTERPARDVVVLTFTLQGEPGIDRAAIPGREEVPLPHWLYEEWDVDRAGRCHFEVLLSNGWSVKLLVRDFHYVIGKSILPGADGPASRAAKNSVSKSA